MNSNDFILTISWSSVFFLQVWFDWSVKSPDCFFDSFNQIYKHFRTDKSSIYTYLAFYFHSFIVLWKNLCEKHQFKIFFFDRASCIQTNRFDKPNLLRGFWISACFFRQPWVGFYHFSYRSVGQKKLRFAMQIDKTLPDLANVELWWCRNEGELIHWGKV